MPHIGFGELSIILAIAFVLFGAKRLPETARAIGKSFNAFKAGLKDVSKDIEDDAADKKNLPESSHIK